jgi:anthranilate synthase
VGRDRTLALNALNERGRVILRLFNPLVESHAHWDCEPATADSFTLRLKPLAERFPEEERSKQPSPFSLVRLLVQEFRNAGRHAPDAHGRFWLRSAAAV